MNEAKLFILSEHALTKIVDQIKDDQWDLVVPEDIQEDGWTLKKLINYHAYDDAWVPDILSGKTIAEVGTKYDGDLLGNDPKASWHAIVATSIAAVEGSTDFDKMVHLSYGDFSVKDYLWHITLFRTLRIVDFARFLNLNDSLPDELVQGMWEILQPNAQWVRNVGVLGPEVEVPSDAPLQERFLGLAGKQPKRTS